MDKKFTPEEIAKSLRVCIEVGGGSASKCRLCALHGRFFERDCFDELNEQAADMIEAQAKRIEELEAELEKLRRENRWIPVGERLPEDGRYVPVIVSGRVGNVRLDRAVELAEFSMDEGWILEMWPDWENPTVTHWKPMPKGPEAE